MIGFTEILPKALKQYQLPGLSVAGFVKDRSFAWSGGFADLETQRAISPDTLFPIASCTKPVTAALVMDQVQRGNFDLDTTLKSLVPEFRLMDPKAAREMTVRDLLCHRTGLPPHTWSWVFGDVDRDTFMLERLPHLASHCGFRDRHAYSNIMYAFAGTVLQRTMGKSWEQLVDPRFEHLESKWFEHPNVALPYRASRRIPFFHAQKNHLIAPASELMAAAPVLAGWLREQDVAEMAVPQTRISSQTQYGLGWRISKTVGGHREIWHSGQCSGYTAWMSSVPRLDAGIVLLTNHHGAVDELSAMANQFYARIQSMDHPLPEMVRGSGRRDNRVPWETSAKSFDHVRYENPGYGRFEIKGRQAWFQNVGPFDLLQDEEQRLGFELPVYGVRFLMTRTPDTVSIPFDSKVEPIKFERV